jgi:glucosamine 6-phosphate synthetase-like amidotransferase/phosphosugar isomerase protein
MCGIYLSNNVTSFEVLEQANRVRGNFSTGIFYSYRSATYNINHIKGTADWDTIKLPVGDDGDYIYLGHNQAPTSSARDWKEKTSHPFWYGDWVVAHNGVLTNFSELVDKHVPAHDNPVDSSIIPAMLDEFEFEYGPCETSLDEIRNIKNVISKLEGTFAVWVVNTRTMNTYIARQGSTLFYKEANVSSIKGIGYKEVEEGVIYSYNSYGIAKLDKFTHSSPFFTL